MFYLRSYDAFLIFAFFVVFCLSVVVLRKHWSSFVFAVFVFFVFLLGMLLTGLYVVSNYFTGNGIDESVLFHLVNGVDGLSLQFLYPVILGVVIYLLLVFGVGVYLFRMLSSKPFKKFSFRAIVPLLSLSASFSVHPAVSDLYWIFQPSMKNILMSDVGSSSTPEGYVDVSLDGLMPETESSARFNLIYLYLESLERTYLDENVFPGLTPNLNKLRFRGVDFSNIQQVYGTGWTIAGMVSSQCGAPLITPLGMNRTDGLSGFLPEMVCLGDILKAQGYFLSYMGGADLRFADKGKFYRQHGFDEVLGRAHIESSLSDSDYVSQWGIYDDVLYDHLIKRVISLSNSNIPYGIFALTLDTHAPEGFPSRSCANLRYQDGSNPMLNAVHCADHMVGEFVAKLDKLGVLDNTVLVIASDHLAMHNSASNILDQVNRRNLLLVIHPERHHKVVDRPGSTLDVAPTLLTLMGISVREFGFGRDLLSDNFDHAFFDSLNHNIVSHKLFFMNKWRYDQMENGVTIIPGQDLIKLSGNKVTTLPMLVVLEPDGRVGRLFFEGMNSPSLIDEIAKLPDDASYTLVDLCKNVALIPVDKQAKWCLVKKSGSGEKVLVLINEYSYFSRKDFFPVF